MPSTMTPRLLAHTSLMASSVRYTEFGARYAAKYIYWPVGAFNPYSVNSNIVNLGHDSAGRSCGDDRRACGIPNNAAAQ